MLFSEIIGNDNAKRLLSGALDGGRPSHAYLFQGPRGVGKFSIALEFARALMGLPEAGVGASGLLAHPDFAAISPEGPTNTVKIDQIRGISRGVSMRPSSAARKVFVVDDADRMTEEAANSILKTLEEPPDFMAVILVTSVPARVLPTVRSRCCSVPFAPVGEGDLTAYLMDHHGLAHERAAFLSRFSGGSVGVAISAMLDEEFMDRRGHLLERLGAFPGFNTLDILLFCQEYGDKKEQGLELVRTMRSWFRDVFMVRTLGDAARAIVTNLDEYEAIRGSAQVWDAERLTALLRNLADLEIALNRTRGNITLRLALEAFMFKSFSSAR